MASILDVISSNGKSSDGTEMQCTQCSRKKPTGAAAIALVGAVLAAPFAHCRVRLSGSTPPPPSGTLKLQI